MATAGHRGKVEDRGAPAALAGGAGAMWRSADGEAVSVRRAHPGPLVRPVGVLGQPWAPSLLAMKALGSTAPRDILATQLALRQRLISVQRRQHQLYYDIALAPRGANGIRLTRVKPSPPAPVPHGLKGTTSGPSTGPPNRYPANKNTIIRDLHPEAPWKNLKEYRRPKVLARREEKALERELQRRRREIQEDRKRRHQVFVRLVINHREDFVRFHRMKALEAQRAARAVKMHLETLAQRQGREEDREERKRLQALKENDMEAYAKLVQETKNQRLRFLLEETDKYLHIVGQMIEAHRGNVDDPSSIGAGPSVVQGEYVGKRYLSSAHRQKEAVRQPSMLVGGDLKEYQLAGLQWMVSLYNNQLNGILADEMGLGKTIQTIALISYLIEVKRNMGPYLIVVPLSTLSNWTNEFRKWAPTVLLVRYKGLPEVRRKLYKEQVESGAFNVLLTTYEYVMKDRAALRRLQWQYIIVDEGHRMKNANSKFAQTLGTMYQSRNRLLLTGTPLQNDLAELWALLNFLLPSIFNSMDTFDQWFNKPFASFGASAEAHDEVEVLSQEERMLILARLHELLRPFMMRRVKSSVMDQLPDKVTKVLRCDLSAWQRILYRQIQSSGTSAIAQRDGGAGGSRGLSNVIMQLRKVCNHPFLFRDEYDIDDDLIRSSGKFTLLDRMLPKLKAMGHRVLIFSQMTQVMNILERFFAYRGFRHLRLDGSTSADEREKRMEMFNDPNSPHFIFLLSTRAGGLGLNLATADTVILFDSDWNPMMDAQAQDRAHRIGQKNEVRVFRLVSNSPIEQRILQRATDKLNMTELVVEAGKFNQKSKESERADMVRSILQEVEDDEVNDEAAADALDENETDNLNEMMATSEQELAHYSAMDRAIPKGARLRPMREAEVPAWVKVVKEPSKNQTVTINGLDVTVSEMESGGRGARRQTRDGNKSYAEMSERQFIKMIEGGGDGDDADASANGGGAGERGEKQNGGGRKGRKRKRAPSPKEESPAAEQPLSHEAVAGIKRVLKELRRVRAEDGRQIALLFLDKPSKRQYPDYYTIIKKPVAINSISQTMRRGLYNSAAEAVADMRTMFANARTYNAPGSWVYEDAVRLEAVLDEAIQAHLPADVLAADAAAAPAPAPAPAAPAEPSVEAPADPPAPPADGASSGVPLKKRMKKAAL